MIFVITEGLKNIGRAKLASAMVSLLIGTALLVGGWFFLLTVQLESSSSYVDKALEIEAFLTEDLSADGIDSLRTIFEEDSTITGIHFISKDSAAALFYEMVGEDIRTLTGENILPPSFRLNLKQEILLTDKLDDITASITELNGVDDVRSRREYLLTLLRYKNLVWAVHVSGGIIIFSLALLVIINIIRLSIESRSKSIDIMQLIGATNRFISAPFIIEGFTVGLIGGAVGCLFSHSFLLWLTFLLDIDISLHRFFYPAMFGAGCSIGLAGSLIAIRRFLTDT
ncbi:cell division protein FtsX [candidate division KSB1 bacterium]